MSNKPQRQPHPHTLPTYGATIQYAKHINQSPPATKEQQKYIQQVIGVLLYYGRAVYSTLLVALSSLARSVNLLWARNLSKERVATLE